MKDKDIKSNVVDYVKDTLESIYNDGVHEFEFRDDKLVSISYVNDCQYKEILTCNTKNNKT